MYRYILNKTYFLAWQGAEAKETVAEKPRGDYKNHNNNLLIRTRILCVAMGWKYRVVTGYVAPLYNIVSSSS